MLWAWFFHSIPSIDASQDFIAVHPDRGVTMYAIGALAGHKSHAWCLVLHIKVSWADDMSVSVKAAAIIWSRCAGP